MHDKFLDLGGTQVELLQTVDLGVLLNLPHQLFDFNLARQITPDGLPVKLRRVGAHFKGLFFRMKVPVRLLPGFLLLRSHGLLLKACRFIDPLHLL